MIIILGGWTDVWNSGFGQISLVQGADLFFVASLCTGQSYGYGLEVNSSQFFQFKSNKLMIVVYASRETYYKQFKFISIWDREMYSHICSFNKRACKSMT